MSVSFLLAAQHASRKYSVNASLTGKILPLPDTGGFLRQDDPSGIFLSVFEFVFIIYSNICPRNGQ